MSSLYFAVFMAGAAMAFGIDGDWPLLILASVFGCVAWLIALKRRAA